ncbi:MAG: hypothetical protein JW716_01600 [Candidatus Aenigmarchaeota archaeon]|nr:hypothetical protein [Candidatus Aenigmarchaeota archaeon]
MVKMIRMPNKELSGKIREFTEEIIEDLKWGHIELSLESLRINAGKITKEAGIYCMIDIDTESVLRIGKATNKNGIHGRWIDYKNSHIHAIKRDLPQKDKGRGLYESFFRVVKDRKVYLLWAATRKDLAVPIEELLITLFVPVFEEYKSEWRKIKNKKEFNHNTVIESCFEKRRNDQKTIELDSVKIKYKLLLLS